MISVHARGLLLVIVVCFGTMPSLSWCAQNFDVRRRERSNAPDTAIFNAEMFGEAHGRPLLTRGKSFVMRSVEVPTENNEHFESRSHYISHQYLIRVEEAKKSIVHAQLVRMAPFVQYLAYDTFQIVITKSEISKVLGLSGVIAAYDFPTTLKMHEELISFHQSSGSDVAKLRDTNVDFAPFTLNVLITGHFKDGRLNDLCGSEVSFCNVREVTPGKKLAIDTDKKNLRAILQQCTAHPLVTWVEERKDMKLHNKYASRIVQGQGRQNSSHHPFWEGGLTGKGEIIGEDKILPFASQIIRNDEVLLQASLIPA